MSGSRAYGVETPESDWDSRGVCVPPARYLLGLSSFEQHQDERGDHVVFALAKFARLALAGNPNLIELLWTDGPALLVVSPLGERLLAARERFLSRRLGQRFCGYAAGQLERIRRHRVWLEAPPTEPDPAAYGGQRAEGQVRFADPARQTEFRAAQRRWRDYQRWRAERNPRRAALEERFGYDTKHAMHLCRLLTMGLEALREGAIRVRRPDADWLRAVREGLYDYDQLLAWAAAQEAEVRAAEASSPLPEEPDEAAVEELVIELQQRVLAGER